MPRPLFSTRGLKALQSTLSESAPAAMASYTLIGAIILLGGIGYAIDKWRGTSPWFLFGGLILGLIVGFYGLRQPPAQGGAPAITHPGGRTCGGPPGITDYTVTPGCAWQNAPVANASPPPLHTTAMPENPTG